MARAFKTPLRRERIFRPILVVDDDPFRAFARCTALETAFYSVTRAATASEAFLKLDEPGLGANLALVIAGLKQSEVSGPAFVRALVSRLKVTPILAVGQPGETAQDYPRRNVRFLPAEASPEDILRAATETLSHARAA